MEEPHGCRPEGLDGNTLCEIRETRESVDEEKEEHELGNPHKQLSVRESTNEPGLLVLTEVRKYVVSCSP